MEKSNYSANYNAALLKIASRCNLNCDYCYMYQHADQSWRRQPVFMDIDTISRFAQRLDEYVKLTNLKQFSVLFHGGEPLLYGAKRIVEAADMIRGYVTDDCSLDFSLQTNGVLLTEDDIVYFRENRIGVSISIDGPQLANDLHRLDHRGNSTFAQTLQALHMLNRLGNGIFQGVIAVIDTHISAKELFEFFFPLNIPRLDLLLPDATHVCPPKGRIGNESIYSNWLIDAFELWFTKYSALPLRFFDAVLGSRLGIPSATDAMGFGRVSLLVVETDGSYTDHDVFKITEEGANNLVGSVQTYSFQEVAIQDKILEHGYRLTRHGVANECKVCPVVDACGGGAVMHRFHRERRLDAPTVYCQEMFDLFRFSTKLLRESMANSFDYTEVNKYSLITFTNPLVIECARWRCHTEQTADSIANKYGIPREVVPAAAILLRNVVQSGAIDFSRSQDEYVWLNTISIQRDEPWLTKPFSDTIWVMDRETKQYDYGISVLDSIEEYLAELDAELPLAIAELISDIIFVESAITDEAGIFSFSDDSAPSVLYIATYAGDTPIPPEDLTDSILHEFLHQTLYHIERETPLLFDYDFPRFPAPWISGMRPSGGFLHGTFVFSGLAKYWDTISKSKKLHALNKDKARNNAKRFREQAIYGLVSTYHFALLTPDGIELVRSLADHLGIELSLNVAPGGIL